MSVETAILYGAITYFVCMLSTIILLLIVFFLFKRTLNNMVSSATNVITTTRAKPGEAIQTFIIIAGALASSWAISYLEEKAGEGPLNQKLYDIINKTTAKTETIKKEQAQAKAAKQQAEPPKAEVKQDNIHEEDIKDAEFQDVKPQPQTK